MGHLLNPDMALFALCPFQTGFFFQLVLKTKLVIGNDQLRRPLFFLIVLDDKLLIGDN